MPFRRVKKDEQRSGGGEPQSERRFGAVQGARKKHVCLSFATG